MTYKEPKQLSLSDRLNIEVGIETKMSFKQIANQLDRHPSTIAHEIKANRTFIAGNFPWGNDCQRVHNCVKKELCGESNCNIRYCKMCRLHSCHEYCDKYLRRYCVQWTKPPYVCNRCSQRKLCSNEKYIYTAKHADAISQRRRSESRQGIHTDKEELKQMDELVTPLINKGQPLTHIYAEHEDELPICLRSLYNYIEAGHLTTKNIDLRRKTSYRPRKKKLKSTNFGRMEFRKGRTYQDFEILMKHTADDLTVEMDTVKGVREAGKRLLTMIFRKNSVMLLFLMPDGKASSVKRVFDYLEAGLGVEAFQRLFPYILTDNGSEFKKVDELELTEDYEYRTHLYYCDSMASWQKPHIEKNHEYIRYVIRKGKSLNPYVQEDITLLMNHINSTRRPGLEKKSPYEILLEENDEDMMALWHLLKMDLIPPDEVHLKPDLFKLKV